MGKVTPQLAFAWMNENEAGPTEAARHFGVKASTVRSWVYRYNGPKHRPPPVAGPDPASVMPEGDRAETVAHVRGLRLQLVTIKRKIDVELADEATDWKVVLAATEAAARITAQMATLLKAHPGLMALVEDNSAPDAAAAAANIDRLLG